MAHLQRHWSIEHSRTAAVQQDCEQKKISDITAKNFVFICKDGDCHFAPAYDLLPSNGLNGYHTTSINDSIVPSKEDLIAVAVKAGLNKKEADAIFSAIKKIIAEKQT